MKNLFLLCALLFLTNLSFGQDVIITNNTGLPITAGVQYTCETPNVCPPTIAGSLDTGTDPILPFGGIGILTLPAAAAGCPGPNRPFVIGAFYFGGGSASWQVNTCWNPECIENDGPLTITVTYCSDSETHVTVDP